MEQDLKIVLAKVVTLVYEKHYFQILLHRKQPVTT